MCPIKHIQKFLSKSVCSPPVFPPGIRTACHQRLHILIITHFHSPFHALVMSAYLWRMSCTVLLFPSLSAALGTTYILGFTRRPRDPKLASVQLNTVQASSVDPPSFITEYSVHASSVSNL